MVSSILQLLPIAVFTLGAPAFVILTFYYWRNQHRGTRLFRIFTALCAGAFLSNLATWALVIESPVLAFGRGILAALLAPLMAHLTLERTAPDVPRIRRWRMAVALLYALAVVSAAGRDANISEAFEAAPSFVLIASAGVALGLLRHFQGGRNERRWLRSIFTALLLCAAAIFFSESLWFELAPDYLLLLFFSVHLYYSERLAFFDVFLRRGVYVAVGVMLLTAMVMVMPFVNGIPADLGQEWRIALGFLPLWLLAPLLYRRLEGWIDQRLGRRYSPSEAESTFALTLQRAATEDELKDLAVKSLGLIFSCPVELHLEGEGIAEDGDLLSPLTPSGYVILKSRSNQAPFLSDDHRLLEVLGGILAVVLQNVRLRRQRAELVRLAGQAELKALRAQIDPHFLFNALNAVASSIALKPEEAEDTLAHLADVFRYTLSRSDKEWVSLSEEMQFIRAYLGVEQARFGPRLQVEIQCTGNALEVAVPTMIVQPLVENAIKHGTAQVVGTGRVWIDIASDGDRVRITVRDNGPGFSPGYALEREGPGHGLRNIRQRLHGHYGGEGGLRWENGPMGAEVSLDIPKGLRQRCAS